MFKLIAPCHFGLESVLKREIYDLGYDIDKVEDGRVTFIGDEDAIVRANLCIRTAERILIEAGRFTATTYDELFEGCKKIEWDAYIPKDGKFWVKKASSVKSKLFSPSDIQSIVKKSIVESLKRSYHVDWFEETGNEYPIRVFIFKDEVVIGLDTSGESLHKRGYRKLTAKAPISETLASALIMLTPWKKDRILVDPFCGSGTFAIEAAMMACNMAPGLKRNFLAMSWDNIVDKRLWNEVKEELRGEINKLALYSDLIKGREIKINDVENLCFDEGGRAQLIFIDGVCANNYNDVARALKYLRTQPLLPVLAAITNRLRPALIISCFNTNVEGALKAIGFDVTKKNYALNKAKTALKNFGSEKIKTFMIKSARLSFLEKTNRAEGWQGFELIIWELMSKI